MNLFQLELPWPAVWCTRTAGAGFYTRHEHDLWIGARLLATLSLTENKRHWTAFGPTTVGCMFVQWRADDLEEARRDLEEEAFQVLAGKMHYTIDRTRK